jgi:hypothetical protein
MPQITTGEPDGFGRGMPQAAAWQNARKIGQTAGFSAISGVKRP